jgi:uncharacterized membrane protein YesL
VVATSLGQMAKKAFWNAYDHLGSCLLLNLIWFLLSLPWLAITALMVAAGWGQVVSGNGLLGFMVAGVGLQQLFLSPVTAAAWWVTAQWAHYRAAPARALFSALRRYAGRALILWLFFSIAAFLLSVNAHFYRTLLRSTPLLSALAGGLMVWAYLFLVTMEIYAPALLVGEDLSIKKTLQRSLLLVLDNIRYTVVLGLLMSVIVFAGLISLAGLIFLSAGLLGIVANTGLRQILKKYESIHEGKQPRTWAEVREMQDRAEEESRGWKDLWKPWEGRER